MRDNYLLEYLLSTLGSPDTGLLLERYWRVDMRNDDKWAGLGTEHGGVFCLCWTIADLTTGRYRFLGGWKRITRWRS